MKFWGDFFTFLKRLILLYIVWGVCRLVFFWYNYELIGAISWHELPLLLQGAFIFDSASIFYINLPFLLFSLAPLPWRSRTGYQGGLRILFTAVNTLGLTVNIADVVYYPFKLARITADDWHFVEESNFSGLLWQFAQDYWYAYLLLIGLGVGMWYSWRLVHYRPSTGGRVGYYGWGVLQLVATALFAVVMIRGGNIDPATFPMNVSDASMYATPRKTALVASNPFAVIRTIGTSSKISNVHYMTDADAERWSPTIHTPPTDSLTGVLNGRNVMIIILESIATPHIKALSQAYPEDRPSITPFLDSLIGVSYTFTNAHYSGLRSIDALPSLWASIPSFKTQFLALTQASTPYRALPAILADAGYTTAFYHGAVRSSMSFVAFGNSTGVSHFGSREDYEKIHGTADYDGNWGIFDHKFLPFVADEMSRLPQPFFVTLFTLSSHHPYTIPEPFRGKFSKGTQPIHESIGYSDESLRRFFTRISHEPWFRNTLFILTADHGSGADSKLYLQEPYNHHVPLIFYTPDGILRGRNNSLAQHIDVMPTVLDLLGDTEPYMAFGSSLFVSDQPRHAINYQGGAFNYTTDSLIYIFDEKQIKGLYDYRADPLSARNLSDTVTDQNRDVLRMKAFIQQYYTRIKQRNFTVGTPTPKNVSNP